MRQRRWVMVCIALAAIGMLAIIVSLIRGAGPEGRDDTAAIAVTETTAQPRVTNTPVASSSALPSVPVVTPVPTTSFMPVRFIESEELRLPNLEENLQYGQIFHLRGTVLSDDQLKSVTVTISHKESEEAICDFEATETFGDTEQIMSYSLEDTITTADGTTKIPFDELAPGNYTLTIFASTVRADDIEVVSSDFIVDEQSEWLQLTSNNFRDNYCEALNFFGQRERFLFKYKWAEGRSIETDPEWVKTYITLAPWLNGSKIPFHVDGVPYMEKAVAYLENTYIRVHGNGHDTGVIKLATLVKAFNGSYVSRFVSDRSFISHHAFGTALDINAAMSPNRNSAGNWDVIRDEVKNCLSYDGIREEDGIRYYEFTYTGDWQEYEQDVPTSVINYLLYELAFFRAGFGWGYYYPHTCDAMHFSLSERDITEHGAEGTGLRKVFQYDAE